MAKLDEQIINELESYHETSKNHSITMFVISHFANARLEKVVSVSRDHCRDKPDSSVCSGLSLLFSY